MRGVIGLVMPRRYPPSRRGSERARRAVGTLTSEWRRRCAGGLERPPREQSPAMASSDDIGAGNVGGRSEDTSADGSRPHAGGLANPSGGGQTTPGHGPEDVPPAKEGADFGGGTPEDLKP